jgi:hypothetical protein
MGLNHRSLFGVSARASAGGEAGEIQRRVKTPSRSRRRKAVHFSADASAGNVFGSRVGDWRLRPRRLPAKA